MKKGLGIGGLVLSMLVSISLLRAADVKWQAVSDAPRAEAPAATLEAPIAIKPSVASPAEPASSLMPLPGTIQPVGYETPIPVVEPPRLRGKPEIIAVSAPLNAPAPPPLEEPEELTETGFAVDRPFRPVPSGHVFTRGSLLQTSAGMAVPAVGVAEVPMVPGWEAPVDTSWGVGVPTGPLPEGFDTAEIPAFNPLRPRFYASGQYLMWWTQGQSVPVLATTGDSGILGHPGTQILFGGNQINSNSPFSGGLFTLGYWLGCDRKTAAEFTFLFLGPRSANFTTNSSLNPIIGRPFLEANNGQEFAQLTSLPGVTTGRLTINSPTFLYGFAGNLRCLVCCGCNYRVTALVGFRNLNLNDRLTITENVQGLATAPPPFTNQTITVTDSFSTQNHFYGGNIGADLRYYWGRWSIDVRGQVALGDTVQLLNISGSQRFVSPTGTVQNFTGGLLGLPSNIGHYTNNAFSVIPWIGVNLGYQILPNLRGFVGYNFLYWSNVIRPGSSIDRSLDVTQIPNFPLNPEPAPVAGQHPAPGFHEVGFWAQGISFGFEFMY